MQEKELQIMHRWDGVIDDGPGAEASGEAALHSGTPFTSTPYTEAVLSVSSSTNLPPLSAVGK